MMMEATLTEIQLLLWTNSEELLELCNTMTPMRAQIRTLITIFRGTQWERRNCNNSWVMATNNLQLLQNLQRPRWKIHSSKMDKDQRISLNSYLFQDDGKHKAIASFQSLQNHSLEQVFDLKAETWVFGIDLNSSTDQKA